MFSNARVWSQPNFLNRAATFIAIASLTADPLAAREFSIAFVSAAHELSAPQSSHDLFVQQAVSAPDEWARLPNECGPIASKLRTQAAIEEGLTVAGSAHTPHPITIQWFGLHVKPQNDFQSLALWDENTARSWVPVLPEVDSIRIRQNNPDAKERVNELEIGVLNSAGLWLFSIHISISQEFPDTVILHPIPATNAALMDLLEKQGFDSGQARQEFYSLMHTWLHNQLYPNLASRGFKQFISPKKWLQERGRPFLLNVAGLSPQPNGDLAIELSPFHTFQHDTNSAISQRRSAEVFLTGMKPHFKGLHQLFSRYGWGWVVEQHISPVLEEIWRRLTGESRQDFVRGHHEIFDPSLGERGAWVTPDGDQASEYRKTLFYLARSADKAFQTAYAAYSGWWLIGPLVGWIQGLFAAIRTHSQFNRDMSDLSKPLPTHLHARALGTKANKTSATKTPNEWLDELEQLSQPPPSGETIPKYRPGREVPETKDVLARRQRLLSFYNAFLAMLNSCGIFSGQTLVYIAPGLDILPGAYAKTIGIDTSNLRKEAFALLRQSGPSSINIEDIQNGFIFKTGSSDRADGLDVESYPNLTRENIKTPHKTIYLKGVSWFLFKRDPAGFKHYLNRLDAFLNPGDRILIVDEKDASLATDWLKERGYKEVEDWLNPLSMERLHELLGRMAGNSDNEFPRFGSAPWQFLSPTTVVVLEKPEPRTEPGNWTPHAILKTFQGEYVEGETVYSFTVLPGDRENQCNLQIQTTPVSNRRAKPTIFGNIILQYHNAWPALTILEEHTRESQNNPDRLFGITMSHIGPLLPPFTHIRRELRTTRVLNVLYAGIQPALTTAPIESRVSTNYERLVERLSSPPAPQPDDAKGEEYLANTARWYGDTQRLEMHLHHSVTAKSLLIAFERAGVAQDDVHLTVREGRIWTMGYIGPQRLLAASRAPEITKRGTIRRLSKFSLAFAMRAHALPPGAVLNEVFSHLLDGSIEMEELYGHLNDRQWSYARLSSTQRGWTESPATARDLDAEWTNFFDSHYFSSGLWRPDESRPANLNLGAYPALHFVVQTGVLSIPMLLFLEAGQAFLRAAESGSIAELSAWPVFEEAYLNNSFELRPKFLNSLQSFFNAIEAESIPISEIGRYPIVGPLVSAFLAQSPKEKPVKFVFTMAQAYWGRILVRNFDFLEHELFELLRGARAAQDYALLQIKPTIQRLGRTDAKAAKQLGRGTANRAIFDYLAKVWKIRDPSQSAMSLFSLMGLFVSTRLFRGDYAMHEALYAIATHGYYLQVVLAYAGDPSTEAFEMYMRKLSPDLSDEDMAILFWALSLLRNQGREEQGLFRSV